MLGSKEIDTISNSDIYDTNNDLYLSKKEREEKLLQGIQWANGLTAQVGAKKADGTALTVTTQKMRLKTRFIKGLQYRYILTSSSIQFILMALRKIYLLCLNEILSKR